MVFKVDFYHADHHKYKNGNFPTLKTALIYAESVTECFTIAKDMLESFKQNSVLFQIEEEDEV